MNDYETTGEVTGDDPLGFCDHCIRCMILLWENYWGRRPTENELNIAWKSALEANIKNESIPKKVEWNFEDKKMDGSE